MTKKIKGKKLNMTQIFLDTGRVIPVTVVSAFDDIDNEILNKDVEVIGKSKGKGFTGVMKRWGFSGQQATRGQSNKPRAAGAIGAQTPGKVFKGKKMAGRKGNKRVTVKGLKIVNIDKDNKQIMVSGPIPGARNSEITIKVIE
jgi:large subunit ribosomal protein L3